MRRILNAILFLCLLVPAGVSMAQTRPSPRPGDTLGWYVVRPGDTLERITARYLGTSVLWKENWRLNPQIKNPHLLKIGQRLRIIVSRKLPPRSAEIRDLSHRVDEKPHPNPWTRAHTGDLLKEKDGVHTFRNASALLAFDDGTNLELTESSLIFLRAVRKTLSGTARDTIEVVDGQADIQAHPHRADAVDLEVLVGGAKIVPKPGRTGRAYSRTRKPPTGGAELMVYGGKAGVTAAGTTVAVPAGMGTAVPKGKPPLPPEKLLPAPQLLAPPPRAKIGWANPVVRWKNPAGSATATLEVFRDRACTVLVSRTTGLRGDSTRVRPLPAGTLYWRVTAVSSHGLDGYPSRPRRLMITNPVPDLDPPTAVVFPRTGATVSRSGILAGPKARLDIATHDDVSGISSVQIRWDGARWTALHGRTVRVPSNPGAHTLEIRTTDRAGRRSTVWHIPIRVEPHPPAPPSVILKKPPEQARTDGHRGS